MHAAIYDAVNAIARTHEPYLVRLTGVPRHASKQAASAAAAHAVLAALYPAFHTSLDDELQQSLTQIPAGKDKDEGMFIGQTVADCILALRSNDGANAQPIPYVFGGAPGDYQSTPPNFPSQPHFTHWSHVAPFALERANQFLPGPPPALTGDTYSEALNEIKSLGTTDSTTAAADEELTGRFWNGAIQNYWNEITQTAALDRDLTIAQSARLFALLNLALADGVIAFYDAKYTYNFWRPVTAIRAADIDGSSATAADANWLPEVTNTAPDPSYPGAHAVISSAEACILEAFFKVRHFENEDSRLHVGPVLVDVVEAFPAAAGWQGDFPTAWHFDERGPKRVLGLLVDEHQVGLIVLLKGVCHHGLLPYLLLGWDFNCS